MTIPHSFKLPLNQLPRLNQELELDGLNFLTADTGATSSLLISASQILITQLMANHLEIISLSETILPTQSLLLARVQSQDADQMFALIQLLQSQEVGLLIQLLPSTIQYGRPRLLSQILSIKYKKPVSTLLTQLIIKRKLSTKLNKLQDQRVISIPTGTGIINQRMLPGTQNLEVV